MEEAHKVIDPGIPMEFPGAERVFLDFFPYILNDMTWGQWRLVLDCLMEFVETWSTVELDFRVKVFDDRGGEERLGDGSISIGSQN